MCTTVTPLQRQTDRKYVPPILTLIYTGLRYRTEFIFSHYNTLKSFVSFLAWFSEVNSDFTVAREHGELHTACNKLPSVTHTHSHYDTRKLHFNSICLVWGENAELQNYWHPSWQSLTVKVRNGDGAPIQLLSANQSANREIWDVGHVYECF